MSVSVPVLQSLDYYGYIIGMEVRQAVLPALGFFFIIVLAILVHLRSYKIFRIILSVSFKKPWQGFDRNYVKPTYQIEEN